MRATLFAATSVAAFFAVSTLPSDAQAQARPPSAQHPAQGMAAPSGSPATTAGMITEQELRDYARARRALEANLNVPMVLRQGESYQVQALERYLPSLGVMITAQDYIRIDRAVRADPTLEEQVRSGQLTGAGTEAHQARVSEQQFEDYMRVRRQLDQEPNRALVLRQGDDHQTQALERYLARAGSMLTANDFRMIHLIVQNDPQLRARVEAATSASGAAGVQAPATAASPQ
jgi:hypothetical protein